MTKDEVWQLIMSKKISAVEFDEDSINRDKVGEIRVYFNEIPELYVGDSDFWFRFDGADGGLYFCMSSIIEFFELGEGLMIGDEEYGLKVGEYRDIKEVMNYASEHYDDFFRDGYGYSDICDVLGTRFYCDMIFCWDDESDDCPYSADIDVDIANGRYSVSYRDYEDGFGSEGNLDIDIIKDLIYEEYYLSFLKLKERWGLE